MSGRWPYRAGPVGAVGAVAVLALTAACTGAGHATSPTVRSSSPSRPVPPFPTSSRVPTSPPSPAVPTPLGSLLPDTVAATAVHSAYRRFWVVAKSVDKLPPSRWRPTLAAVAVEPLLSQLLSGYAAQATRGLAEYGTVVPHPRIASFRVDRASIVDCQDDRNAGVLDVDTGQPRTVGSARTLVSAVLIRDGDGRWLLSEARYLEGPC